MKALLRKRTAFLRDKLMRSTRAAEGAAGRQDLVSLIGKVFSVFREYTVALLQDNTLLTAAAPGEKGRQKQ